METLKSNPAVTYRLATQDDLVLFYGKMPPYSSKSLIFFLDGEPAGLGGYKIDSGMFTIFSEFKEGIKVSKQTIYRCAKIIMEFIAEKGCPMYAVADNPKLCESLGLKHYMEDCYKWHS